MHFTLKCKITLIYNLGNFEVIVKQSSSHVCGSMSSNLYAVLFRSSCFLSLFNGVFDKTISDDDLHNENEHYSAVYEDVPMSSIVSFFLFVNMDWRMMLF